VDFAATDVSLAPEELERQGLAQFPFVSGGIAVVTNVAGVATGTLRLSGDVLARIYLGRIQRWSDPALAALNPGVTLPNAPINVLRRGDGSGTTQNLTAFLAASNAEWRERFGVQAAPAWLVGVGARGNRALAEAVRATTNSIGYVEASEAARLRLSVALLQNAAGRFVGPAPANLRAALAGTRFDPASHFHLALAAPQGEEAYPLTATIYALVPRQPRSTGRVRRALEFFRLALREGAADATALGFVPLPAPVVAQVEAYWHANIRGAR
jgi:phosphate transport system substrate-binding protein